jgi:hypothetical protein
MPKLDQTNKQNKGFLINYYLAAWWTNRKPANQPDKLVLIDKDQRPVGKLGTLSPLMNNVQEFGR